MRKVVLITGCSTGIGYATAVMLHNLNYSVFATARKESDLKKLQENGLNALFCDISENESIRACVEHVLEKTGGRLDVLINNAAYGQVGALEDISREALTKQFETNLFGTHEMTLRVLPTMKKQGHGLIINISSVLGLVAMPLRGAYNASKFALEGLTDTLRMECKRYNIHVSLIEPGPIETHFRNNAIKAFSNYVHHKSSAYLDTYQKMESEVSKHKKIPFSLPPEAVAKKILKAITSKKPKAHYFVTVPTYIFAFLKRILPTSWLDYLLTRT